MNLSFLSQGSLMGQIEGDLLFFALGCLGCVAVAVQQRMAKRRTLKALTASNLFVATLFAALFWFFLCAYAHEVQPGLGLDVVMGAVMSSIRMFLGELVFIDFAELLAKYGIAAGTVHAEFVTLICFVAPLMTFRAIISFLKLPLFSIRYQLSFLREVYLFSGLNERSVTLAQNIYQTRRRWYGRPMIVFCSASEEEKEQFEQEIFSIFGMTLADPLEALHLRRLNASKISVYCIGQDEAENVNQAIELQTRWPELPLRLYCFTASPWAEDIIDRQNAHALEQQDDSRGLFIRQVNVAHRMVCQQLYDHPLFSTVDARASSRKELEVLVLGCGTLGAEFARTSLYAGQMPGVSVRVTAVDQLETQALRAQVLMNCPELEMHLERLKIPASIRFMGGVDLSGAELEKALEENRNASYIIICTGDDFLNASVAHRVRRFYLQNAMAQHRAHPDDDQPCIYVRIASDEMSQPLEKYRDPNTMERYAIRAFGSQNSVLSYEAINDWALERDAMELDDQYKQLTEAERRERYERHAENVKRSNLANALHAIYKIQAMNPDYLHWTEGGVWTLSQTLADAVEPVEWTEDGWALKPDGEHALLTHEDEQNDYRDNPWGEQEHSRWMVFNLLEGFIPPREDEDAAWKSWFGKSLYTSSTKNMLARVHRCLEPYDHPNVDGTRVYDMGVVLRTLHMYKQKAGRKER